MLKIPKYKSKTNTYIHTYIHPVYFRQKSIDKKIEIKSNNEIIQACYKTPIDKTIVQYCY